MIDLTQMENYRENNRLEAKKALGGLPESIWETYSAFANTLGGIILLGVEEHRDKSLHPIDIAYPEEMIDDLFEGLNNRKLVSTNILSKDDVTVELADGKHIIVIRVPRADDAHYPVYINGDPVGGAYFRLGEADHRSNSPNLTAAELAEIKDFREEEKWKK